MRSAGRTRAEGPCFFSVRRQTPVRQRRDRPMRLDRTWLLFLLACIVVLSRPMPAWAAVEVDLALVLAVDISNSMDPEEQELQREGFVEAFRAAPVHNAIQSGMLGRIAVVYMEWAGSDRQNVVVPWTVIDSAETAAEFAERLARAPIQR